MTMMTMTMMTMTMPLVASAVPAGSAERLTAAAPRASALRLQR
jgi:hypothetical protein